MTAKRPIISLKPLQILQKIEPKFVESEPHNIKLTINMAFELNHSSLRAFLVPNSTKVTIKVRGEDQAFEDWQYCGFDDERKFVLITSGKRARWIPINSISYIEQAIATKNTA